MIHRNWQVHVCVCVCGSVCALRSQVVVPTTHAALGIGIVFFLEGVAGSTSGPSRVGCDAGVEHMGISLRPSSCWVLHATTAAGAISRLLRSAAFIRLKAALIGSLTLFVAKTRSGGKVVDSYTPARRGASTLHGLGLESNLHVILNLLTDMPLLT